MQYQLYPALYISELIIEILNQLGKKNLMKTGMCFVFSDSVFNVIIETLLDVSDSH